MWGFQMSPWGRRQKYELPRVGKRPMRTPTSEHRNLECSARWQSYCDNVVLLLRKDPYWLLRRACGPGGSVESLVSNTLFELAADLQFVRTG